MMRILLTIPYSPNEIRNSLDITTPPLGLAYIAGYIKSKTRHDVMIHDGMFNRSSPSDFKQVVREYNPDIVGISAQATPAIYDAYGTAQIVKEIDPSVYTVLGGAHATFQDRSILSECQDVDFVIRGEGELTMVDLLSALKTGRLHNVKSLTYREQRTIQRNPMRKPIYDLDSIPFPAYELLDLKNYFKENVRLASVISSRGCPFKCRFCSSSRVSGKKWRGRSAENVIAEIKFLINEYGITNIEFLDDLFTYDTHRVERICELLKFEHLKIGWTCSARADIISSNPHLIRVMKNAGCRCVYMGVESGSPRILSEMKKDITLSQIYRASKAIKDENMGSVYSFILGYPGETEVDLNATISLACKLDPDFAQFTLCTPYPGTPLYNEVKEKGLLTANSWLDYSILGSVMTVPGIRSETLKRTLYKAYIRFYLRPSFLLRQIRARNTFLFSKLVDGVKQLIQRLVHPDYSREQHRRYAKFIKNDMICLTFSADDELNKPTNLSNIEIQPIPK